MIERHADKYVHKQINKLFSAKVSLIYLYDNVNYNWKYIKYHV